MGATHFKGPVWSANGFVVGPGFGQEGTHFSGPVISANGFITDAGAGQPGTHFKGPVFSLNGFEGGAQIVSAPFVATTVDSLTAVVPAVNGDAGTRLLVAVAWDRDASAPATPTVTYGATDVPVVAGSVISGTLRGTALFSLAAPAGTEAVTATFVTTATTATVVAYVLANEGGLGTSVTGVGGSGSRSSTLVVVVPVGGLALDIIDIDTQTLTANSGQQVQANTVYGTVGDTHQAGSSSKFGSPLGWTWDANSAFVHSAVPVLPAP